MVVGLLRMRELLIKGDYSLDWLDVWRMVAELPAMPSGYTGGFFKVQRLIDRADIANHYAELQGCQHSDRLIRELRSIYAKGVTLVTLD